MASVFELERQVKPQGKFRQDLFNKLSPADQNRLKALDLSRKTGQGVNYGQNALTGESPTNWINTFMSSGGGCGGGGGGGSDYSSSYSSGSKVITEQDALRLGLDWNNLPGGYSRAAPPTHIPTAEDIIGEEIKRIKEQVDFIKEFTEKNPFAFDELLARQISQEKFKPYYEEILSDFVEPLQTKITRSGEDQTRLLGELTRKEILGETQKSRELEQTIESARQGFAGAGLLGSGIENRGVALKDIKGKEDIADFLAESKFKRDTTSITGERERSDYQKSIEQKQRNIFGQGREYESTVAQDVEGQRGIATKKYGASLQETLASRFGKIFPEASEFLNLT